MNNLSSYFQTLELRVDNFQPTESYGSVYQYYAGVLESTNTNVRLGELCHIISSRGEKIMAEVVGFRNSRTLLMPYANLRGICLNSKVYPTGELSSAPVGENLLGKVLNAFGQPIDGKELDTTERYPLFKSAGNPLERENISEMLETGIKAIDIFSPIGKGQRLGVFAGSGVGKSTLIGKLSKNLSADINVICLIGERGREVKEFLVDTLGQEGLKNSIVVVSTSDQSALERTHAAYTALSISEYFKDQGKDVLLIMDSITRFAMAQREIGLSIGEPPTTKGYPPSVFSSLPTLLERAGNYENKGSITAIYTVLVEGDDFNEPISDAMRSLLDGHIILDRKLSNKGHYPPIAVEESKSRLAEKVVDDSHLKLLRNCLAIIAEYNTIKEMVEIGAYEKGKNDHLDKVISAFPEIESFLAQTQDEICELEDAKTELRSIISKHQLLQRDNDAEY